MLKTEKSYIAGIIDDEGSIMLLKFHSNQQPAPCVSIASTSLELLQWIQSKTNLGTIKSKKNYNPDVHTDFFTYTIKYNDVLVFLAEIEPYLVIPQKKARARLLLDEYKKLTPKNGKYSKEMLEQKESFYKKFMEQ